MSEFELDEQIEASDYADFRDAEIVYFIADLRDSSKEYLGEYPIRILNNNGGQDGFSYARKIGALIELAFVADDGYFEVERYHVPKELRDKIKAGEVNASTNSKGW